MTFRIFVALVASLALVSAEDDYCHDNDQIVQSGRQGAESYKLSSPLLQLFPGLTIPCNGYLAQWEVAINKSLLDTSGQTAPPGFDGLNLGVFRRFNGTGVFELVGRTRLAAGYGPDGRLSAIASDTYDKVNQQTTQRDSFIPVSASEKGWYQFILPASQEFPVMKGDVIGVYYDSYTKTTPSALYQTNPSASPSKQKNVDVRTAYVFLLDAASLSAQGNRVDTSAISVADRLMGITAHVDAQQRTTLPPPTTRTTTVSTSRPAAPVTRRTVPTTKKGTTKKPLGTSKKPVGTTKKPTTRRPTTRRQG